MPLATIDDLNGPLDEVARRIEQAKGLSVLYNTFVEHEVDGHDRAPGIHASELYPCLRRAVYSARGQPRQPKVSKFWRQRFKMGSAVHSWLQDDFHRMARADKAPWVSQVAEQAASLGELLSLHMTFEDEIVCAPDKQEVAAYFNIQSSCDGIFTFRDAPGGPPVLRIGLEIKSESPDQYAKLNEVKPEHLRQGHLYMACLDLPLMWFLYVNKGNQNNTPSAGPYLVPFNPYVWQEVEARCAEVLALSARGELPARTETILCEFCPFSYTCQPSFGSRSGARSPKAARFLRGPED